MFKIGFDAKRLFNNFTGLGNYSRTLVQGLQEFYPENRYYLYTTKTKDKPDTTDFFKPPYILTTPKKGSKNLWRSMGCTKEIINQNLDIYHGLSHELPLGINKTGAKAIVTIHDLIYKTYPNDFKWLDNKIYDFKFKHACEKSNKIIAVSQSTKTDLEKYYKIPSSKIEVVYQSCQQNFKILLSGQDSQLVLKKYNLPDRYLLYVGSIIERKNLLGIVKAINKIKDQLKLPLVVVGKGKTYEQKVKEYITKYALEKQIIFTSEISYLDLPALYQNASLFIYPSFYEGFGIPLIEALWSKTPVITSNISSLPEAAGPGAYYCEPNNSNTIAEGIIKILTHEDYAQNLIKNGFDYVQRFESRENSKKLMQVYQEVLNKE